MFQRIWIRKKFNQVLESLGLQSQNRVTLIPYPVGFILPICEIGEHPKGYGEKVQAFSLFLCSLDLQSAIMYCIVVV